MGNPSEYYWSNWSSVDDVTARVDLKIMDIIPPPSLILTPDINEISITKNGSSITPSTKTITVNSNASVSGLSSGVTITKWEFDIDGADKDNSISTIATSNVSASKSQTFSNISLSNYLTSKKIVFSGRVRYYAMLADGTKKASSWSSQSADVLLVINGQSTGTTIGDVICAGTISPQQASAQRNPFTGQIDPPTTDVQVGVSASISSTGGKRISKWDLYCNGELIKTITGNNTSVSAPLGTKTYTVDNNNSAQFNFSAKVYFTDGTNKEGNDTKIFGVEQQTLQNNPPTASISLDPNVVVQGDDIAFTIEKPAVFAFL